MDERQGQWIRALSIEMLEKKVEKLDEYLFDVILDYNTLQTALILEGKRCNSCGQKDAIEGVRGFVHYVV